MGSNRTLALLLTTEAHQLRPDAASRGALLGALRDEPRLRLGLVGGHAGYFSLASLPTNTRIVAIGRTGADVWDLIARRRVGSVLGARRNLGRQSAPAVVSRNRNQHGNGDVLERGDASAGRPPLRPGAPVTDVGVLRDGSQLVAAVGSMEESGRPGGDDAPDLGCRNTRSDRYRTRRAYPHRQRAGTQPRRPAHRGGRQRWARHPARRAHGPIVSDIDVGAGVSDLTLLARRSAARRRNLRRRLRRRL